MELWIRSQDRETLMKVNRIDIQNKSVICYDNDYHCNETYMGIYKSKERALEVLDEIENALLNKWANNVKYEEHYDDEKPSSLVYEMPKE